MPNFAAYRDTNDALAARVQGDELAIALLQEAPVNFVAAELLMTRMRRWLLLSERWKLYPELVAALTTQASLNNGAWPFDETEEARLAAAENAPMRHAYLPTRSEQPRPIAAISGDPITVAVTAQYEGWPYPPWTRITRPEPVRLADTVRRLDPSLAPSVPVKAEMLVAGCGSGRHAASVAAHYPDAMVTGIDVSEASLAYARRQCAALGIHNVRFLRLDLHAVAELGQQFDAIFCGGVLHHLPDPERGWAALTGVLAPYGVMRIMVYSRLGRFKVAAARKFISDLLDKPITDDLLRQARRRMLQRSDHPVVAALVERRDFATLAGTHDLLLHRHEDPFDFVRIGRALDNLRLRLLSLELPSAEVKQIYEATYPHDEKHRDIAALAQFERNNIGSFQGNYRFWCARAVDDAA